MAKVKIGSVSLTVLSETTAQYLHNNNSRMFPGGHAGLGVDSYINSYAGSLGYASYRPEKEGATVLLSTALGNLNGFGVAYVLNGPETLRPASLVLSVWETDQFSEMLPGWNTSWYTPGDPSEITRAGFMRVGQGGGGYGNTAEAQALARSRWQALVDKLSSNASAFLPTTKTAFNPATATSISIANATGFDAKVMPTLLSLDVATQKALMDHLEVEHAALHAAQFKVTSSTVQPEFFSQFNDLSAYSKFPLDVSYALSLTSQVELEFFGDPETGGVSVEARSGGAAVSVPIPTQNEDLWLAFLADKKAYDKVLASHMLEASIGSFAPIPIANLIKPASISALTIEDQVTIAETWWEDYSEAVSEFAETVTAEEAHAQSGSPLSLADWLAAERVKQADVLTNNSSGLWQGVKNLVGNAAGAVGDYVGKYSPTEWVTAGTGLWAGATVIDKAKGLSSWAIGGLIALAMFLFLK